jgi:type IV secretory pathway TraG/TraD family ATPase VirD4
MPVTIRPNVGPINRVLVGAALCLGLAWTLWPSTSSHWQEGVAAWSLGLVGSALTLIAGSRLVRDYRLRANIAISQLVSEDHGSAREASRAEIEAAGLDLRTDLLGLDAANRPVWRPRALPFSLWESPPGGFKTVSGVMPWIISRALDGYSIVIADPKRELYAMLAEGLRSQGLEVWGSDPTANTSDGLVALNPYQAVIDAVHGEGDERKNAVRIASDYAAIHYPTNSDEKNPYFAHGSRRVIVVAVVSEALLNPAACSPTSVYNLITDPQLFMERLELLADSLEAIEQGDAIVAFLRGEARNLIDRANKNEENYASFLEGASQRLLPFNPAGHLGNFGEGAFRKVRELRERQIVLFLMSPLSHTREFAQLVSLQNHNIVAAVKASPSGHRLHIMAEEALNFRFHELTSEMETLRQLGLSADFFVQSYAGLEKAYGREAARAIESYADVRVYSGLNSYERAKFVSDNLSDQTLRAQEFSYQSTAKEVGVSSRELSRPLMKPNEVLAMDRREAWVFVRGMNPMKLQLVHYGEIDWWGSLVEPSPITGTRLHGNPRVKVEGRPGGARG